MTSAFPNRYIDKTDPQYQRRVRHVVVLQPPSEGAAVQDFVRYAQDLESGIEAKTLSDSDLIPRSSYDGQKLTLQSLKDEVVNIIAKNPKEWIRGCVGIAIMYHPDMREKFVAILSALPISAQDPNQKLLSVSHGDDLFAVNVQLHENRSIPVDGSVMWLHNPSEPAAEHIVPSDQGEALNFTDIYATKQKMEYFAMMSLRKFLIANGNISPGDPAPRYEPLGNVFPDFELIVRSQEWAVEVTRIERGMVSYLRVSEPLEKETLDKVGQNEVTESGIIKALTDALADKTEIRDKCSRYARACLLLVDVVDSIDAKSSAIWNGIDMSAFDAVALVKMDGSLSFIKGPHAFD